MKPLSSHNPPDGGSPVDGDVREGSGQEDSVENDDVIGGVDSRDDSAPQTVSPDTQSHPNIQTGHYGYPGDPEPASQTTYQSDAVSDTDTDVQPVSPHTVVVGMNGHTGKLALNGGQPYTENNHYTETDRSR